MTTLGSEDQVRVGLTNLSVREKWLKKVLARIAEGKSILDAGAGELQYKKYCHHLHYVSQDFGKYEGSGDGKALQTGKWDNSQLDIISDIINIPVEKSSFDAVMCVEVLEHVPDPKSAIKEFSRILKQGGKLIITAPFCSLTHFSPYFFHTGLSKYWYKTTLQEFGLKINEIATNGNYFEYLAQELRRLYFMSEKYAKTQIAGDKIIEAKINDLLKLLEELNKKQKGSEELLNFGLHVLATKK